MAYLVVTKGSRWYLIYRVDHGQGVVKQRSIRPDSDEFRRLGFAEAMSVDEARVALGRIRLTGDLSNALQRGARIAARIRRNKAVESAYLPAALVEEFEQQLLSGITQKPDKWQLVKKLVTKLPFSPEEWNMRKAHFYQLFAQRGYSTYTIRLYLRLLNGWGAFYCRRLNLRWDPIPRPTGESLRSIKRAHLDKTGGGLTTEALTPETLTQAEIHLGHEQRLWLAIALWFGLRREEVEQVKAPQSEANWYVLTTDPRFKYVLMVYQWKLHREAVAPALCWKAIPAVCPEQEAVIEQLLTKPFKQPTHTELKKLNPRLTLRSGRKGFGQLMNGLGYAEHVFDRWLGHVGKGTFSKYYSNKEVAYWEAPTLLKRQAG